MYTRMGSKSKHVTIFIWIFGRGIHWSRKNEYFFTTEIVCTQNVTKIHPEDVCFFLY